MLLHSTGKITTRCNFPADKYFFWMSAIAIILLRNALGKAAGCLCVSIVTIWKFIGSLGFGSPHLESTIRTSSTVTTQWRMTTCFKKRKYPAFHLDFFGSGLIVNGR